MPLTDNFFEFLIGGKPVSLPTTVNLNVITNNNVKNEGENEENENIKDNLDIKKEMWILYILDKENEKFTLDCFIISNFFKFIAPDVISQTRIVTCTSCSPKGILPILVAQSNGQVLEVSEIVERFFKAKNITLYVAIDSLLGKYVRNENPKPSLIDVVELIEALPGANASLDPLIDILLFSIIQSAKSCLNFTDPVRLAIERSEYLGELYIGLLELV